MATKGLGIGEKMLGTSNRPYLHRAISTALYAHIGAASALVASLATAQDLPIDRGAIALEPVEIVAADGDADSGTTKTGTIRIQTINFEEHSAMATTDRIFGDNLGAIALEPVEIVAADGDADSGTTKTGTIRIQTINFEEHSATATTDRILGDNLGAIALEPVEIVAADGDADSGTTKTGTIRIQTINFEEHSATATTDRILGDIRGAKVRNSGGMLQAQTVSLRGAAAQDIGVTYRGVSINALSDAVADFAFFVPELLSTAHVYGTGAVSTLGSVAGLVELTGNDAKAPIQARISGTTLGDFGLFWRGSLQSGGHRFSASAFGDDSPGAFRYIDAQDTPQFRQHNAAARLGGELVYDAHIDGFHLAAFSLYSQIDRQEAGVSEYPDSYRRAHNDQWLSLSRIAAESPPIAMGHSYASFALEFAYRSSKKTYENPTMLIGQRPIETRLFEIQPHLAAHAEWDWASISTTKLGVRYDYQRVESFYKSGNASLAQTHERHILSASIAQSLNFVHDSINITALGSIDRVIDAQTIGSASVSIAYRTPFRWRFGFSGAYAQRMPSFDELYYRTEFIRGNPDLKPQKSAIHELSIAYDAASFALKFAGFYNIHRDLIRFVPETPTLTRVKNFTDAIARGVELAATWNIYAGLGLKLDYAWTDATTKNKTPLPQVPEHRFSSEIFYKDTHFSCAFIAQYESGVAQNLAANDYADDRIDLSLEASLTLPLGATLSVAVYNLLDDQSRQDVVQRPLPGRYGAIALRFSPF